jgi:hypothetical protein
MRGDGTRAPGLRPALLAIAVLVLISGSLELAEATDRNETLLSVGRARLKLRFNCDTASTLVSSALLIAPRSRATPRPLVPVSYPPCVCLRPESLFVAPWTCTWPRGVRGRRGANTVSVRSARVSCSGRTRLPRELLRVRKRNIRGNCRRDRKLLHPNKRFVPKGASTPPRGRSRAGRPAGRPARVASCAARRRERVGLLRMWAGCLFCRDSRGATPDVCRSAWRYA